MVASVPRRVGVPTGAAVLDLLPPLRAALDGVGPALLPAAGDEPGQALVRAARLEDPVADGVALLLPTSGSTGSPKLVELGSEALTTSALAAHARLGGPGRWLLALPVAHVAGWQVLVRSAVGGHPPVVVDLGRGFTAEAFRAAAEEMPGPRRYTALVPAQLRRLLDHPTGAAALRRLDAVLVGGAATPARLLERCRLEGVPVVVTYGMTETCGGCVYDGRPLDGVDVDVDDDGRVLLSGPVLAGGYRARPDLTARAFRYRDGRRWFATSDAGSVEDGRVVLHGRLDDVIVTGGVKVAPSPVETVLSGLPGIEQCLVVGVRDDDWGEAVVALVAGTPPPLAEVRRAVTRRLGPASAPRHVLVVEHLPSLGIGKPDRGAAADLAAGLLHRGG